MADDTDDSQEPQAELPETPFAVPWPIQKKLARCWMREYKQDFAEDGNPVYAWRAIDVACRHEIKMPKWVMAYLLAAAREILSFCEAARTGETSKEAERVGKALGFGVKGPGRGGWFQQAALREADEEIFFAVGRLTHPVIEEKESGKCVTAYPSGSGATICGDRLGGHIVEH